MGPPTRAAPFLTCRSLRTKLAARPTRIGHHPAGPVTSQACRSIRTRTFDRENTDPDEGDTTHSTVGNRTMLDPKAAAPDKPCRVYYGPSGLTFTG